MEDGRIAIMAGSRKRGPICRQLLAVAVARAPGPNIPGHIRPFGQRPASRPQAYLNLAFEQREAQRREAGNIGSQVGGRPATSTPVWAVWLNNILVQDLNPGHPHQRRAPFQLGHDRELLLP